MKKIVAITLIMLLCCLLILSSCDSTPYLFYKRRVLNIKSECNDYMLKRLTDLNGDETLYKITSENYVSKEYLLDSSNDGGPDKSFYNFGGLYVYMSNRTLHVYHGDSLYDLDEGYFRKNSQSFNDIEQIWTKKYNVKQYEVPNFICGAVYFDGCVFILAQNKSKQEIFDKEHLTNLWKFDYLNGAIEFCGFCEYREGLKTELASLNSCELAIVKN